MEGYRFIGWDKSPVDFVVHDDEVFIARYEPIEITETEKIAEIEDGWQKWRLSGCLNWLLSLLFLLLIGLLLWFLFGHHNINFCGSILGDCDCEKENTTITDTIKPNVNPNLDPVPDPQALDPCQELQSNGHNQAERHLFNMGQIGGSFLFEYATGDVLADSIVIYDGKSQNDKIIFEYYGTTGSTAVNDIYIEPGRKTVHFSSQYILIDVIPDPSPGTSWEIKVNCPQ